MSDKTKTLIIEILTVITLILLIALFPGSILISFLVPTQRVFNIILYTILFAFLGIGGLLTILLPIFSLTTKKKQTPAPVKADKYSLVLNSYGELAAFLQNRLLQKEYTLQKTLSVLSDGEVTLYVKPSGIWELDCFAIIRVPELSDDLIEKAEETITEILTEYYGKKNITDTINMISVFCVDRTTPAFQKLVNTNVIQGFKIGRFIAGVSFGGKNIYVAKQKGGPPGTYAYLRKNFFDIMEIQNIKK